MFISVCCSNTFAHKLEALTYSRQELCAGGALWLQQCHGAPLKGRPLQVQLAASDGNSDDMPKSRMVPRVPIGRIANGRVARLMWHRGVLRAKPFRGVLGWTRCGKRKRINKRNLLTHYGLDAYLNSR